MTEFGLPHVVAALLGYLLGSIPFGLLLTKLAGLGDIIATCTSHARDSEPRSAALLREPRRVDTAAESPAPEGGIRWCGASR